MRWAPAGAHPDAVTGRLVRVGRAVAVLAAAQAPAAAGGEEEDDEAEEVEEEGDDGLALRPAALAARALLHSRPHSA